MPKGYAPSVFISSTCYDLGQHRADISAFISNIGYDPLFSESPSFPINPHKNSIENCTQVVKERADIFVLLLGTRYGSQVSTGESITNLEYLEARNKGIPIYIFVLKQLLNIFPLWEKHPENNYTGFVDTPKLFQFLKDLRSSSNNHWVFPFDEVANITPVLKHQFALLAMEGLILRDQISERRFSPALMNLSGRSLKLALERPIAWEHFLFAAVLEDEITKDADLKWDLRYSVKLRKIYVLSDMLAVANWLQEKMASIIAFVHSADVLINKSLPDAVGAPGEPGDPDQIVYVARRVAQVRQELLRWSIEFNCTKAPEQCERMMQLISDFSKGIIQQIEGAPKQVNDEVTKAVDAHKRGEKYVANVQIVLSTPYSEELAQEFRKINLGW